MIAVLAVLLGSVTACSSGSSGSSASGSSAPIRIAGDATLTIGGVPAAIATGTDAGARARYWLANSQGGINGRKIDYLGTADDGDSATTLVGNMSKQVLQDNVLAIAPYDSEAAFPAASVQQNKVPIFGKVTSYTMCLSQYVYGFGGCLVNQKYDETDAANALTEAVMGHAADPKTGAITVTKGYQYAFQVAAPVADAVPIETTAAKADGWSVCYQDASIPGAGTTDYSTYAANVMRSCNNGQGPNGMLVLLSTTAQTAAYISTLRALGWKGQAETEGYDPASLTSPEVSSALAGSVTYLPATAVPGAGAGPIFAQITSALAAIGQPNAPLSAGLLRGWIQADMAVKALQAAGSNRTGAGLQTALKNWTYPGIAGLTPEVPFPLGHSYPIPCSNVMKVSGTGYQQLYPFACAQVIDASNGSVVKGGFQP